MAMMVRRSCMAVAPPSFVYVVRPNGGGVGDLEAARIPDWVRGLIDALPQPFLQFGSAVE